MTTSYVSTPIDHSSDATFRAWGVEHDAALTAIGAVQTADTGQINWATVLRPAINTDAGYTVWRFNDSLQASAPIYFKIYYGTGTVATRPRLRLGVGTGSNGAGVLTGLVTTENNVTSAANIVSTTTNYPSFACGVQGMIAMAFKVGSQGAAGYARTSGFVIARTVDSTGSPSADGFNIIFQPETTLATNNIPVSFLTNTVYATNSSGCLFIGEPASTTVGGVSQVYKHYTITPRARPLTQLLTVLKAENPINTQFQASPIGTSLRNFMPIGSGLGTGTVTNNTACGVAFLWE